MGATERPIYLDYNATTPVDRDVLDAMFPFLDRHFGNPSSDHLYGQDAGQAIDIARAQVASLLGCQTDEIVFTGGGSESDNLALVGRVWAAKHDNPHIVTTVIEHPAILNTCRFLERQGVDVTYLPVDGAGIVGTDEVRRALRSSTVVVSVMHANNETGSIQPIGAIAKICREAGVALHTDAAQSVGKIPALVDELGVDLLTVAGHKLYAPKGIGVLYVRRGTKIEPLIHGAGHEGGRRAGTENVPYIVALGAAAERALNSLAEERGRQTELRDRLHRLLEEQIDGVALNGHPTERLPNTLNLRFAGLDRNTLLAATPEIAASTGSACHAGLTEPSSVLLAMGIDPDQAVGAVRLSLGRPTTAVEIDNAAEALVTGVRKLRVAAM